MNQNKVDIRIYDVPEFFVHRATQLCAHFAMQFPDRVGIRNCCIYREPCETKILTVSVHRTCGGQLVARGLGYE